VIKVSVSSTYPFKVAVNDTGVKCVEILQTLDDSTQKADSIRPGCHSKISYDIFV